MQTLYQIDLESIKDPMSRNMKSERTFRISNIDPTLRTNDILQRVSGRNYEIIWVDNTTFLVAAIEEEDTSTMEAFMQRIFPSYDVECLSDYLMKQIEDTNDKILVDIDTKSTFGRFYDGIISLLGGVFSWRGVWVRW